MRSGAQAHSSMQELLHAHAFERQCGPVGASPSLTRQIGQGCSGSTSPLFSTAVSLVPLLHVTVDSMLLTTVASRGTGLKAMVWDTVAGAGGG